VKQNALQKFFERLSKLGAQGALEYLLLIGSAVLVITVVAVFLATASNEAQAKNSSNLNRGFEFMDNALCAALGDCPSGGTPGNGDGGTLPQNQLLENSGFENADISPWYESHGGTELVSSANCGANCQVLPKSGGSMFTASTNDRTVLSGNPAISQNISSLEAGTYRLCAYVARIDGDPMALLQFYTFGGASPYKFYNEQLQFPQGETGFWRLLCVSGSVDEGDNANTTVFAPLQYTGSFAVDDVSFEKIA